MSAPREATLEKIRFGLWQNISQDAIDHIDVIEIVRLLSENISINVRGFVWGQNAEKTLDIAYPATWWDAFKDRWFKGVVSIRYIRHRVEVKATYPDLKIDCHDPVVKMYHSEFQFFDTPVEGTR